MPNNRLLVVNYALLTTSSGMNGAARQYLPTLLSQSRRVEKYNYEIQKFASGAASLAVTVEP